MGSIRSAIELQDNFTGILMNVINAVNMSVSTMEQMRSTMNEQIDTSSIQGIRDQLNQATIAAQELESAMQNMEAPAAGVPSSSVVLPVESSPDIEVGQPAPVQVPVVWQSDHLDVFTNSGIERFEMEVQSTNQMLHTLNQTQAQIADRAAQTNIFPPNMVSDMNGMQTRLQAIQGRIQAIESNPVNLGTDTANAELERLRAQLNQAIQEQELMNRAVNDMDVQAANEAYQRLSQIVGNTERHIRDNVDEQGQFRREIEESTDSASDLKNMIAGVVSVLASLAIFAKAKSWIEDCTAAFNTQLNAETQLISVLANMLDEDYVAQFEVDVGADTARAVEEINAIQNGVSEVVVPVTAEAKALTAAYDQITEKASEIQGRGIYGDEIMIAGAAEFATYFSDTDAITMMMDTLSNYAVGMSGGGALDASAMVGYATDLGKIMSGAYGAMTKKGFEFTDAQKAIVEGEASREQIVAALGEEYLDLSSDMQAAAAISQVIDEAWGGLYETMSNTPEGKIIQMNNTWGDMMEVVGKQLYPYVLLFVDAITGNWPTIQAVVDGITFGLQVMLGIMSWILEGAINFSQGVIDNWSWISPIVYGVIAALVVYNATMGIAWLTTLKGAAAMAWKTACDWAETAATIALIAAQEGLNAALAACPITWIIIAIIALIAIFYAAVAAVNKFAGTSYSATGIICGLFAVAAAFIGNLFVALVNAGIDAFVGLWNFIAIFANFFGNVFNDPVGAIVHLFFDLADTVLGILETLASAIDTIFGSNLAGAVSGWRDSLGGWVDKTFGENVEFMGRRDSSELHLQRFEYGAAWNTGYSFGEGIEDKIAAFNPSSIFGTTDIPSAADYANALTSGGLGDVGSGVEDIAGNTGAMADAMDITGEELKYLRDIAEQEAINRFTTAEVNIEQTNHNTIKNGMDLDGVISGMTDMVNEAIEISTEGVHV